MMQVDEAAPKCASSRDPEVSPAIVTFVMLSNPLPTFEYVGRFDIYNGFTWFDRPSANRTQRGYHLQAGVNLKSWFSAGFAFSVLQANVTLRPALQTQIAGQLTP